MQHRRTSGVSILLRQSDLLVLCFIGIVNDVAAAEVEAYRYKASGMSVKIQQSRGFKPDNRVREAIGIGCFSSTA